MSTSELQNLEKNIQRLKAQLAGKRNILTTIAPEEKVRIKQQIEDLRLEIRELEREKWELIVAMSADLPISDREAEPDRYFLKELSYEVMEDVAIVNAIREGKDTENVSRNEILALLEEG